MIQFHKSNKNQWTNKFACGENVGKDLTKSPSQISERAIKVIRDYVAALRFPFLRGPSSKLKQIGILLTQMPFFVLRRRLRKRAFDAPPYHKKIAQPLVVRFASFRDSVGIRQNHGFSGGIGYFTGRDNVV